MNTDLKTIDILYLGGIIWLLIQLFFGLNITVCPMKLLYGIPCPACGTTRGIILIAEGKIIDGVLSNPNSIIIFPIIFMYPIIRLYDGFTHKTCSQNIYLTAEAKMGKKSLYIPFVITEVVIWALNIYCKK